LWAKARHSSARTMSKISSNVCRVSIRGGLSPFPVLVTHMISRRDVKTFAKSQGVAVYLSYQLQKPTP